MQSRFLHDPYSVLKVFTFSSTLAPMVLEEKIDFETRVERDTNLGSISARFWHQKSFEIGFKIDEK